MAHNYVFCVVTALVKFDLSLLQAKHLGNVDQWKEGSTRYRETDVLTGDVSFPNTVVGCVMGQHPRCTGRVHFLP
jgi:hypothetical protein